MNSMNRSTVKEHVSRRKGLLSGLALLLVAGAVWGFMQWRGSTNTAASESQGRPEIPAPIATSQVNKTFQFPLRNGEGEEVSQIHYQISSAELRDVIIAEGKRATAVNGKAFLVLNLKITNDYTSGMQLESRDYLRMQPEGSSEWLAPEIHNDPVEVQAISTKNTRLGFTVDEAVRTYTFRLGEINGEKEAFQISFN